MITIKKSINADSRSCDCQNVSKDELYCATRYHQLDVLNALQFFADKMISAGVNHDNHKLETFDDFHNAFIGGFKDETWWNEHKKELHHLPSDNENINMIHVFEFISDCVTSGLARTGEIYPLTISNEMLQKAFQNTVQLLIKNIKVEE